MKIVILSDGIPPEGKGGAERIAWQSATMLYGAGHDVCVITTTRQHAKNTIESVVEGIPVFSIPTSYHPRWRAWISLYNPATVGEVTKILAKIQPDVVHAHNVHEYLSYASLTAARKTNALVVHTIHDTMPFAYGKLFGPVRKISAQEQFIEQRFRYNPWRNIIIRTVLKKVDTLITVSHALAKALEINGIHNIAVIYNGIDSTDWEVSAATVDAFKKKQNLEQKKVILFGGRISGAKGGDALFVALPLLTQVVPNTVLMIVGTESDYVKNLLARAETAHIRSHVILTGWLSGDELRAAYAAADIVAVPSLYLDPLPTVVLEAMAAGKPVVGSGNGGIPEMVIDRVTGRIVDPLQTKVFAEACAELLQAADLAHAYGASGKERQRTHFSKELYLQRLRKVFGILN